MNKISCSQSEIDYTQTNTSKNKNIQIIEDEEKRSVCLKIYGVIGEPEEYLDELEILNHLSQNYNILEIVLNSPGGSVSTTVDIISIIKKFDYVITIGKGEVSSAAFMIWALGNIRVVSDYSMYMAHRESYGMFGKTSEHRDTAIIFGKVYDELFEKCFDKLLTKKEKMIAERSETWISYKDLLERPRVISYNDFINPQNPYIVQSLYITKDSKKFLFDNETKTFRNITISYGDETINDMTEFLYGVCDIESHTKKLKKKGKK